VTVGSLFAGIGGFDLAAERVGWTVKWQVEIDNYATQVLE
jgi:DNA (cytosine-5)-methyltransferase 1